MRRSISSIFILLLLLLTLWGLSAWYLGAKTEDTLQSLLTATHEKNQNLFNYDLLSYEPSIFGAKAELALELNNNCLLSHLHNLPDVIYLDMDIKNGPLFIDKSGVSIGSSIWTVAINPEKNSEALKEFGSMMLSSAGEGSLIKLEAKFKFNFDKDVTYQMPLAFNSSSMLIEGAYNAQQFSNIGKVTAQHWSLKNKNVVIQAKNINIKFKHVLKSNSDREIEVDSLIPELIFQQVSMNQALTLKLVSDASFSVNSEVLNADANIYFKNSENSIYPIQRGDVKFSANNFKINDFIILVNNKSQITDLNQQIEWILEEQGELPEGQAKLWQLEDERNRYQKDFSTAVPKMVTEKNNGEPVFEFSIKSYINNNISYLDGALHKEVPFVLSNSLNNKAFPNELSIYKSALFDLTQLNADVFLDDAMYQFVSSQVPVKTNKFKLIYKNNKLLMQ